MADFLPVDFDDSTGITTHVRFNRDSSGKRISTDFLTTQDVEPILDANKREQFNAKGKACERGRMGFHAARVPMSIQLKWLVEHGVDLYSPDPDQQKKVRQLLNSNEYSHLRVAELQL